jgi:hypothetical protein
MADPMRAGFFALIVLASCRSSEEAPSVPGPSPAGAHEAEHEHAPAARTGTEVAPVPAGEHPAPARLDPREDPAFTVAESRGGKYTVAWRALGGKVPKNEPFELEVWLYADNRPLPGVTLVASGWMPDHGHGMVRVPLVQDEGDGSYRVSGMLFHMRGHWKLNFDVVENSYSERAEFALDIR